MSFGPIPASNGNVTSSENNVFSLISVRKDYDSTAAPVKKRNYFN